MGRTGGGHGTRSPVSRKRQPPGAGADLDGLRVIAQAMATSDQADTDTRVNVRISFGDTIRHGAEEDSPVLPPLFQRSMTCSSFTTSQSCRHSCKNFMSLESGFWSILSTCIREGKATE